MPAWNCAPRLSTTIEAATACDPLRMMSIRSALPALVAALLFGASTSLAKLLGTDLPPPLLAGLLYLGSGPGLGALLLARRVFGRREEEGGASLRLPRRDIPWLVGAIVAGGMFGRARHEHEHSHPLQEHVHRHRHDEHHRHEHDSAWDGAEPHVHAHAHTARCLTVTDTIPTSTIVILIDRRRSAGREVEQLKFNGELEKLRQTGQGCEGDDRVTRALVGRPLDSETVVESGDHECLLFTRSAVCLGSQELTARVGQ